MCGIAGMAVATPGDAPGLRRSLQEMADALRHRGPDDEGVEVLLDGRVGLANRRLAVRDRSGAGHMPMRNDEGSVWVTYNGEIYNHPDLARELGEAGHVLRSRSDTEVILRGYEVWGSAVVSRLRGMFAFAIVDLRPETAGGRLLLARDRLGIKPLYLARSRRGVAFASEARSLRRSPLVGGELDPSAAASFLLWGSVPSRTIYAGVESLPAASTLELSLGDLGRDPAPRRYWSLPAPDGASLSRQDAIERVKRLLDESVRLRLVSDVPLGVFLSGGVDSSAVAAIVRRASTGTVRSCSIGFPGYDEDEGPVARTVADALGLEHHEHAVTAAEVGAELDALLDAMDLPSVDGVNTYFVSKTARETGLTVALSGLGGDELFGGYRQTFDWVPRTHRALTACRWVPGARTLVPAALRRGSSSRTLRLADAVEAGLSSRAAAYHACRGLFSPSEARTVMTADAWAASADGSATSERLLYGQPELREAGSMAPWVSSAELAVYMHNQLLRDTDTMSMAHSLEVRVPLLDHLLVESVAAMPPQVRFAGPPKALLVDAVRDLLPATIFERPKQGFTFPFAQWFRGELHDVVRDRVLSVPTDGIIRPAEARIIWDRFVAGSIHWTRPWVIGVLNHFSGR